MAAMWFKTAVGAEVLTQLEYLLRVVVALLCGMAVGYERESRLKTAGIRTHLIVAVASAMMMIVSKYGFRDVLGQAGIGLDPSRIAAGVVTAIGFLGAGVIFVRKQNVSGLTTAAGLWATVGVGTAIGAGMYFIGVAVTILMIVVQIILHRKNKLVKGPMTEMIILQMSKDEEFETLVENIFESRHIAITNVKAKRIGTDTLEIKLYVKYPERYQTADIIQLLRDVPNIKSIEI